MRILHFVTLALAQVGTFGLTLPADTSVDSLSAGCCTKAAVRQEW